jgi:tetratricopeptide (TPR) repeat protein
MTQELLRLGIQAAKTGDYEKAQIYFAKVVQTDPHSELGWLYLGHCLNDEKKKIYCYQKVLGINPSNQYARKAHTIR